MNFSSRTLAYIHSHRQTHRSVTHMPVLQFKGKTAIECYHHTVPHTWQKLAADFEDETFRFQVLDEGEYKDRDWQDDLKKLLESAV